MVKYCIAKLKAKSSAGPDGFPALLFKKLLHCLAYPLSVMFDGIFQFGEIPCVWKKAIVIPIFKKGSSSDPGNYRPISLTCICCKLFEACIKAQLIPYLFEHNMISSSQHGFLAKKSTCTNLLECLCDWSGNLDKHAATLVAYIDFAKAFDSVSLPKLMHKLPSYGLAGNLLSCIKAFLTNRSQRVRVGSSFSVEKKCSVVSLRAAS